MLEPPERVAAQGTYNFTQFYFNPSLLNPSFTGSDGRPALYLSYKKQWAGMDGSPSIGNLSLQAPVNNRLNAGINLSNDKNGLLSTSGVSFTGAYTLPLADNHFFRFGLSVGMSSTKVDINALSFGTAGDPLLSGLVKNNFRVTGNFGFSYHYHSFHIGASIPNILQPDYVGKDAFAISKIKPFESLIIHASNRFYLAKGKNVFEPYLVYRMNGSTPSQFEVAGVFHIQNKIYLGASYKQNFGISALAGFKLNKQTALGYSYTLKNTGINELSRPSHEFHFAYLFGKPKKGIPMYSFVDTEKEKVHHKTPQQIAAEKKKQEAELAKKKEEEKKKQELAAAKKEPKQVAVNEKVPEKKIETPGIKVTKTDSSKNENVLHNGGPRMKTSTTHIESFTSKEDSIHQAERKHLDRLEEHAENPTEHHNEENHPNADRHEFVKQGSHHAELELGDYVIAGVFSVEENAKHFSDGLVKLGFKDSDYGFLTEKKLWYVHIAQSNDIETAKAYRDKFRKMKIFREAWLLTVHK
jgi:type IX secretion system PorP/SprF family membrane protein